MIRRRAYRAASEQDARTIADALRQDGHEPTLDNRGGWHILIDADDEIFDRVAQVVSASEPPDPALA